MKDISNTIIDNVTTTSWFSQYIGPPVGGKRTARPRGAGGRSATREQRTRSEPSLSASSARTGSDKGEPTEAGAAAGRTVARAEVSGCDDLYDDLCVEISCSRSSGRAPPRV